MLRRDQENSHITEKGPTRFMTHSPNTDLTGETHGWAADGRMLRKQCEAIEGPLTCPPRGCEHRRLAGGLRQRPPRGLGLASHRPAGTGGAAGWGDGGLVGCLIQQT